MSGRRVGSGSIIIVISYSSYSDRLALGENFRVVPSRSFCHSWPFLGRFIDDAISSMDAPRLKMSAF